MLEALTRKYGPLPGWAWGLIVAGIAYWYLLRRKQAAATAAANQANQQGLSSNLGSVPVSNLTTQAQPMPIQMGDTFVNVPQSSVNVTTPVNVTNPPPPTGSLPPAPPPGPHPTINVGYGIVSTAQGLMDWLGVNTKGSKVFNVGGGAPVYFGNAANLATGAQYEQPGYDIYTPVGYGNQVASTAIPLSQPYVAGQ